MRIRCWLLLFVPGVVLATILGACGSAATPTATPAPAISASPAPAPTVTSGTSASAPVPVLTGYSPEHIKDLLAQGMYLPTMSYGAGETPQYGGTAIYANKLDLPTDDAYTGSLTVINILGSVTGDGGLVKLKRTQNDSFEPYLAESWKVADEGKAWTFTLRPDVKWHDGTPLLAEDIKFYIDLQMKPPAGRNAQGASTWRTSGLPSFQEVQVIDPRTVRLLFATPQPNLLEVFATTNYTYGFPKHLAQPLIDKGNVTFGMNSVGWVSTGPFKYERYEKGSSFKATRFDQYFIKDPAGRSLPYLDAVYFPVITDRTVALSAFRAGRIDATARGAGAGLDPQMLEILQKGMTTSKVWFMRHPYLEYGIQMNALKPPFDDVRLRKAICLYYDRIDGAKIMEGGMAATAGMVSPGSYYFSNQYESWPGFNNATKAQDQAEAMKTVKDLGVAGTRVQVESRVDYQYMVEYTDAMLRRMGFNSVIQMYDLPTNVDRQARLQYQVSTGGFPTSGFPGGALDQWVTTNHASGSNFNDTKIDEFDRVIRQSSDPKVRKDTLAAAENYIVAEKYYVCPFYRIDWVGAYRTYLKGQVVPGWTAHNNTDRAWDWIDKSKR